MSQNLLVMIESSTGVVVLKTETVDSDCLICCERSYSAEPASIGRTYLDCTLLIKQLGLHQTCTEFSSFGAMFKLLSNLAIHKTESTFSKLTHGPSFTQQCQEMQAPSCQARRRSPIQYQLHGLHALMTGITQKSLQQHCIIPTVSPPTSSEHSTSINSGTEGPS